MNLKTVEIDSRRDIEVINSIPESTDRVFVRSIPVDMDQLAAVNRLRESSDLIEVPVAVQHDRDGCDGLF